MAEYGDNTLGLLNTALDRGANHVVLLMRHSAREFAPDKHDLLNPLTDEGRELSTRMGEMLPKSLLVRAYASPAERCVETANLIQQGHRDAGGETTRCRPIEALGVFYVLDQMRMYKAMQQAGGLVGFLNHWFDGKVPSDVILPAVSAASIVFQVAVEKLHQSRQVPQLDLLVSHDMTVYTVRDRLLKQQVSNYPVDFLDGLVIYQLNGKYYLQSHHGPAVEIQYQGNNPTSPT